MLCVYPLAFHNAGEAGETDLAMRTFAPQPSASAPVRYHAAVLRIARKGVMRRSTHSATDHFRVVSSVP
jgi:hypothetical protein